MDVCLLINQLAPGGAPTLLLDIVRHTDPEADIDYTVCFIEGEDELAPDFEAAGARVVDFGAEFKFDPRAMWRLFRFFRREEFDVLHAHLPYSQTVGRVFGRLGGIEAIVSTQHDYADNYHPITRLLERITRPLDEATVAVSQGVEYDFTGESHLYPDHSGGWCTIYNGADIEGFAERVEQADDQQVREKYGIGDGPLFLNVARYQKFKRQRDAIEAMQWVTDKLPNAKLLVVGWGPREDALRQRVRDLGLENVITITGRVPDVEPDCAAADAFVFPSRRESFGIALLEAMASELPVVARDTPGPNEIVVDGETGVLVGGTTSRELAGAMIAAATNEDDCGGAGFGRAKSTFDVDRVASQYSELYSSLATSASIAII